VPASALVRAHAELGDTLLPLLAVLWLALAAFIALTRRRPERRPRWVPFATLAVAALTVTAARTVTVQVVRSGRIGRSGAKAVWSAQR
jgi:hypothetical protein